MQQFSVEDKMAHLIQANHRLLPVFHRFGFQLGVRNQTVSEMCEKHKIDSDFFITIVNTFHNPSFFPENELLAFSPLLIIDYLRKTHQYYIQYSLPKIEDLLHRFQLSCSPESTELKTIEEFYLTYKKKLLAHIQYEEANVFPFVEQLVENGNVGDDVGVKLNFEEEHESVDLEIDDLKNLIVRYISCDYDQLLANELISEVFIFEKDILNHARIEDVILIPQVKSLLQK